MDRIPVKKIKIRTRSGAGFVIFTLENTGSLVMHDGEICYEAAVWGSQLGLPNSPKQKIIIRPENYGLGSNLGYYDKDIISFLAGGERHRGIVKFVPERLLEKKNPWLVVDNDGCVYSLLAINDILFSGTNLGRSSKSAF